MKKQVTIAGGGLVGALSGVLLRQQGYEVTIFEKRKSAGNDQGRSINLVITSRGLHALKQAGLLEQVLRLSVPVFGRSIHTKSTCLYQPYGRENECNYSISRSQLNDFLLEAAQKAGAHIEFETSVVDLDVPRASLVVQKGSHQKRLSYEVLLGADGAGSTVRKVLGRQEGFEESIEWLDADYKELVVPADARGRHRLQPHALHIWPRGSHMMMMLPNQDGSFTVTIYLPKMGSPYSFESLKTPASVQRFFESEFPDAMGVIPRPTEQFLENPRGLLGTIRCHPWYLGRVALLGDACHAMVPFFGQGMNCGFEDATVLLAALQSCKGRWAEALSRYNDERIANANAIADMALENWVEMRDKVADPRFQLRKQVEKRLETAFPDLFRSRYGMIAYTRIPYSVAQEVGRVQEAILDELCRGIRTAEAVSLEKAELLLRSRLSKEN